MSHGIAYSVKESERARRLRIVVNCDARVSVVVPKGFDLSGVEKYITEKAEWIKSKILFFQKKEKKEISRDFPQTNYHACAKRARKLIKERVVHYNELYNFSYNRISIKQQSTKWGSCSGQKNLNFNYKILFLPDYLVDYIVVHELCHLKELNHSKKFWELVARAMPKYADIRKELQNFDTISR